MKKECYQGAYFKKTNHHIYISPCEALQDVVAHYTITFPSKEPIECEKYHVLPDASGCIIFQGDFLDYWGPMQELVLQENDLLTAKPRFFIEFRPGGLYRISGKAQYPYINHREPLNCFDPFIAEALHNLYCDSSNYDDFVLRCNAWIMAQAKQHPIPKRIHEALSIIEKHHGAISVETVAGLCAVSLRQMRRDFSVYIGLSPKQYANVSRINHLVKEMTSDDLIKQALQGGFFDQAHFNKVFKQMMHVTPSQYIENIDDFYQELYKF